MASLKSGFRHSGEGRNPVFLINWAPAFAGATNFWRFPKDQRRTAGRLALALALATPNTQHPTPNTQHPTP
jgi:hypothetical protein